MLEQSRAGHGGGRLVANLGCEDHADARGGAEAEVDPDELAGGRAVA